MRTKLEDFYERKLFDALQDALHERDGWAQDRIYHILCQAQQVGAEGPTGQEIDRMDAIEQYRAVEQRQAAAFFIRPNGKLR